MSCNYTVNHGDVVKWCKEYAQQDNAEPFHAVFCDPPYHLTSIVERFSSKKSKSAKHGRDGAFNRLSKGFMGATWDGGDVAFRPETWHAIGSVMHPGAFGMAAAGSRGYHRMAVAIENSLIGNTTDSIVMPRTDLLNISRLLQLAIDSEDWDLVVEAKDFIDHLYRIKTAAQQAGFIIHPAIGWVTVQGFPKGTRIDTQVDEAAGIKIERGKSFNYKGGVVHPEQEKWEGRSNAHHIPQTEMAKVWSGHRYGLQALRPLFEFYCVFQKQYPGGKIKTWESIVKTGAGALNIDGAWIENGGGAWSRSNASGTGANGMFNNSGGDNSGDGGRWPPNLILNEDYVEWSGISSDKLANFYVTDWELERLENADPLVFAAKASIPEREVGLDPMTRRLMREMFADDYAEDDDLAALEKESSGLVYGDYYGKNIPFKDEIEVGTTNDGRKAVSDRPYLRNTIERYNIHPTIKPLSLCEHLCRLLAPPEHYATIGSGRRLLVPFSGSGSEICGAVISGQWEVVVGIELEEKHVKISNARLKYWSQMRSQYGDELLGKIKLSVKNRKKAKTTGHEQQEMF